MSQLFRPRLMPGFFLIRIFPLIAILMVYLPGLEGGYYFDDFSNIVMNPFVQPKSLDLKSALAAATSSKSGPTGRPISMLSFAIGYHIHGQSPYAMKLLNLVLHIVNGILVYILLTMILPRMLNLADDKTKTLALLVSTIWLVNPLHVSTVLYIVQRMTLLSSFFMLLGLVGYVYWRRRESCNWFFALACATVATLLATYSKENGLLLPGYVLAIEVIAFQFCGVNRQTKKRIETLLVLTIFATILIAAITLYTNQDWVSKAYSGRNFNLTERILTEARVVALYQYLCFVPDLQVMGLYHDDYELSTSILSPTTTLPSILWHTAIILFAWIYKKKLPLLSFGIAWFYISQTLESTFWPLELIFEHRTYLASLGLYLALCAVLMHLSDNYFKQYLPQTRNTPATQPTLYILIGVSLIWLGATSIRSTDWGDLFVHPIMEATRHPLSARSHFEAGQTLARGLTLHPELIDLYAEITKNHLEEAAKLAPNDIAPISSLLDLQQLQGKHLDANTVDQLIERLKYSNPNAATTVNLHILNKRLLADDAKFFPRQVALSIFDAAESNSLLSPIDRAEVLVGKSLYLNGNGGDKDECVRLLVDATKLSPGNLHYKILLAAMQIDLGEDADAQKTLRAAKDLDRFGIVADEISHLSDRISLN